MIKAILSSAASLGLIAIAATAASAADLPQRAAPPAFVPTPVFSWTGFYIGGQVGYAFGKDAGVVDPAGAIVGPLAFTTNNGGGVIGGAHVGYNFALPAFGSAFGNGLILGVEGDVDGSSYRASQTATVPPVTAFSTVRNPIQGSIRGRIGFAVDRALFYATGGAAFGQIKTSYTSAAIGLAETYSRSRVGYTVGGGVDYALTNQWSLRGEYRYTDFGTFSDPVGSSIPGAVAVTTSRHETEHRVQAGFSYKFDSPLAPVVARY